MTTTTTTVTAYVPSNKYYIGALPEYLTAYATPERALRAGQILWARGARYLLKVEVTLEDEFFVRIFQKTGSVACRGANTKVLRVRVAR